MTHLATHISTHNDDHQATLFPLSSPKVACQPLVRSDVIDGAYPRPRAYPRAVNIQKKKAFVNGDNVPRLEVSDKNQSRERIDMTK